MIVSGLNITNLRAIEGGEFSFKEGFNLIVGVNGVGKSTVLDAIRICMSRIMPILFPSRAKAMAFGVDDIRFGFPFLDVKIDFEEASEKFSLTRRQWKERIASDDQENLDRLRQEILNSDRLRDRARNLLRELEESQGVSDTDAFFPSEAALRRAAKIQPSPPNCIYFSVNRSVISGAGGSAAKTAGGTASAYAEALAPRSWQVKQFAEWMRAQIELAEENPASARHVDVLNEALATFLPDFKRLRTDGESASGLLIEHEGVPLDIGQLSDGERGILGMVLDLARRLSQANPNLKDPLKEGQAIVLIDELDLHLHPKWQRQIVRQLTETFPCCQFIATTHSPQIIGEVEHNRVQIIADGQVHSPTHSFGVDASRVLEEVMDTDPRTTTIAELLKKISTEIGRSRFDAAREILVKLVGHLGENDPEVTRMRTLLDFMEGEE